VKIARALKDIHDNCSENLDVSSLARSKEMSVSSFILILKKSLLIPPCLNSGAIK
jgi:hypothetical protein